MFDDQVPPQVPPPGSIPPPPGSVPPAPPPPGSVPPAPQPPGSVPPAPPPPSGALGPMPPQPGDGGPPVLAPSGRGSVAWTAVGVYLGLAVLQVLVGFWAFNNAYAEIDPNGNAINSTVMTVLFVGPSLIALGLVIWMSVAMVTAKRRAAKPDPAAPILVTAGTAGPALPPPPPRGSRTRMGVLIGSAAFLITCAGPCFGPSLGQFTSPGTPEPIQTTSPGPLPDGSELPAEPGPPGVTFTAVP